MCNIQDLIMDSLSVKIKEIKEEFEALDRDRSGFIDASELGSALRRMGLNPSEKQITDYVASIDENGDGKINFDEFFQYFSKSYEPPEKIREDLLKAFQVLDLNKDGYISKEELREVMTTIGEVLSEEEVDKLMAMADKNGDGKIDYEEYVAIMTPAKKV